MKKKTTVVLAALAFAAIVPTSTKADDPVSPVQGAIRKVYNIEIKNKMSKRYYDDFANTALNIVRGEETPYSISIDTSTSFRVLTESSGHTEIAMWSGFLKRKSGGLYSFVITTTGGNLFPIYSLWVNGDRIITYGTETNAKKVMLNPGFNEIILVVSKTKSKDISMNIKRADSIKDPVNIGPGDFWHEDEPDDEDDE